MAILGGMGRTRNGSYAELVAVPATNVVAVNSPLPWAVLAAVPEAYATAHSALHGNLALKAGETLVVRGATSSLGQAAVNLAVHHGATVLATTRNPEHGRSAQAGLPSRLPRRTLTGGGLRPDRRSAQRRSTQLLRQRIRPGAG